MKKIYFLLSCLLFFSIAFLQAQTIEIYVSDAGNFSNPPWQIAKFDENGENPEKFIGGSLAWPQDILFLEDQGVVLISNLSSDRITKHDASTGDYIENFATNADGPTRMAIGPDGLLYALQWNGNGKVFRYQLDGTFVDEFTNIGIPRSIGIAWDTEDNLYVSSYSDDSVHKFDTSGNSLGDFITTNLVGPTNIWFVDNGDLFVLDYDGGAIKRFDANGDFIGTLSGGLSGPEGVAHFANGSFLVGNGGDGSVKLFDSTGTFVENFIEPGAGNLIRPNAVVIREIPVATKEIQVEKTFVTPSIGSHFRVNSALASDFPAIDVYDATGKFVQTIHLHEEEVWDATSYPEGLYYLIAIQENIKAIQKIVVQK